MKKRFNNIVFVYGVSLFPSDLFINSLSFLIFFAKDSLSWIFEYTSMPVFLIVCNFKSIFRRSHRICVVR